MRALLCDAFDGIGALSVGEAAEPYPGADEVLIDVHAASVSYMDYLMICGGIRRGQPSLTCRGRTPPAWSSPAATRPSALREMISDARNPAP
jgi:NADPH:quinone reductase-like Zn-dependent oxidoreductase